MKCTSISSCEVLDINRIFWIPISIIFAFVRALLDEPTNYSVSSSLNCTMGYLKFFKYAVFMASVLSPKCAVAEDDPPEGYSGAERDALLAFKAGFNHSFLDHNWTHLMCYMNQPPFWYGVQCTNGRVTGIVLESLGLSGKVESDALFNLTKLSILSLRNNSIFGNVMDFSNTKKMAQIDLSGNEFDGPISASLLGLASLESLQLQDNNLSGSIPGFNQPGLRVFNVSNNHLSGRIPNTTVLQAFPLSSFSGNEELCGFPTTTVCNYTEETKKSGRGSSSGRSTFIAILVVLDVAGLIVILALFIIYYKRFAKKFKELMDIKKGGGKTEHQEKGGIEGKETGKIGREMVVSGEDVIVVRGVDVMEEEEEEEKRELEGGELLLVRGVNAMEEENKGKLDYDEASHRRKMQARGKRIMVYEREEKGRLVFMDGERGDFELYDLLKASAEGLGKGSFGNTYKAKLDGGPTVVVQRLRSLKGLSSYEFFQQLKWIADQKHPNLLPLLAYYNAKDEKLLVYKFAPNGNVYNRLHDGRGTKSRSPFPWSSRLSVARGVARALEYLHSNASDSEPMGVPHGHLKSSNVLLDHNDTVLVTHFGLVPLLSLPAAAQRLVAFRSPEFQSQKRVSKKSDVWSFGCLVLELMTGRASLHSAPPGTRAADLCSWVDRAVREEWTAEIFDAELPVRRRAGCHGAVTLLQLGMRCCQKSPEDRPDMGEVVREIESIKVIESSEDDDDLLFESSLTDDSMSATPSIIINSER